MPALAESCVKVVLRGTINSNQTWSTGCYFISNEAGQQISPAEAATLATDLVQAAKNWWGTGPSHICNVATDFSGLTVYGYNPTSEKAYVVGEASGIDATPGQSNTNLPALVALVTSLRTGISGRSYRGRVYSPMTGANLGNDGRVQGPDCDRVNNAWHVFLNACSAALVGGGLPAATPAVASFTKGFLTPITDLITDNVPDTQHRREDKIGYSYRAEVAL